MDISFIRTANSTSDDQKKVFISPHEIDHLSRSAMLVAHFAGARPLFLIKSTAEPDLVEKPDETVQKPDCVLTTADIPSVRSGRVIKYQLKHFKLPTSQVMVKGSSLKDKIKELAAKNAKHLIVVADDETLKGLKKDLGLQSQTDADRIYLQIFKNGKEVYSKSNRNMPDYITEGIYDSMLQYMINKTPPKDIPQWLTSYKGKIGPMASSNRVMRALRLPAKEK